ncbi:peptidoglycan DD-metalloendopeptidase family protein [Viridibacillus arvi]|uniref:peptidoglycan DD-metalloendopeptidase family protein n=1 Tax=Viridibacillus arvi TaxID=263475 RepID=UPI0034CF4639
MGKNRSDNGSQDLAKGVTDGISNVGGKVLRGKNTRKLASKGIKIAAKLMKSLIQKTIMIFMKVLGTTIGPYIVVGLLIIILLLLVVDSVKSFDIFQEGGERTDAEVLFDDTVLDVMKERQEDGPTEIREVIRSSQDKAPYEPVNETWLYETGEYAKVSFALPTIHHYYKNLKNENYKAWHDDYKNKDVSTEKKKAKVRKKFKKIISKEYDYYFGAGGYKPNFSYAESQPEYKEVHTIKQCKKPSSGDDEKVEVEWGPSDSSTTKTKLKSRQIITGVSTIYNETTIYYKTLKTKWSEPKMVESGNCKITTKEKYTLYVIDDGRPVGTTVSATALVSFLVKDAPEGKLSKLVKVVDLQYALELGKEIDPAFPSVDIKFEKLIQCAKKGDLSACIGEHVLGATPGILDMGGGGTIEGNWYPGNYMELYKKAADTCGIDWFVLASVHGQETRYSSNPVATDPKKGSYNAAGELVGAVGHFQFMPMTWVGWGIAKDPKYATTGLGNLLGDLNIITDLSAIKKYGGYGKDANGNGKASPWEIEDAAVSAACYMKANGYKKDDEKAIKKALYHYNMDDVYVAEVYARAMKFKNTPPASSEGGKDIPIASGTFSYPTTGRITAGYGTYNYGKGNEFHYGMDIGGGGQGPIVNIVSVADGVVSRVSGHWSYGNVIFVKHNLNGQTFETLYAHMLNPTSLKVGETVKKGQKLGVMGESGNAYGRHLHFEIHTPSYISQRQTSKNPAKYIPTPPTN